LPAAKVTQINEFTPAAWANAKAKGKWSLRQPEQNSLWSYKKDQNVLQILHLHGRELGRLTGRLRL
jgi:hypothetical protein